ncbi:unnamed protein product [Phytophthora fragariaefolia]|uniref:GrpE protein homolog n=1 Tax=Phytophthora fragariaefolia TaxID=1490495 RepID=A0A9W6XXH2_9STRA|nr:unnamed protein product [Phytophthora fragariaefolia]
MVDNLTQPCLRGLALEHGAHVVGGLLGNVLRAHHEAVRDPAHDKVEEAEGDLLGQQVARLARQLHNARVEAGREPEALQQREREGRLEGQHRADPPPDEQHRGGRDEHGQRLEARDEAQAARAVAHALHLQVAHEPHEGRHLAQERHPQVVEPSAAPSEAETLQQQLQELEAKNKDMNDRLLRALADAENVRRISRVDVSNAREFAISKFAKALLDVSDNLKRAHESIDVEALQPEKQLDAIKVLHEGVVMTENQLQKVFREFKIQQVGAVGDKFDPNVHDALFEYEDATKEAGSIGQLMKTGYLLNERVIRPAQVGVVKAPKEQ